MKSLAVMAMCVGAAVFGLATCGQTVTPPVDRGALTHRYERPIIVLMLDDLDQPTFDQALSLGILPNIQAELIDKGTTFTNSFVTASICCPSRASFASGQHPFNCGTYHNGSPNSAWLTWEASNTSLFEHLKGRRFRTSLIGKWINGYSASEPTIAAGIDAWQGLFNEDNSYSQSLYTLRVITDGSAQSNVTPGTYQADEFTDRAQAFINAQPYGRPWFLYLAPTIPHASHTDGGAYTNRQTIREFRIPPPLRWAGSLRESGDPDSCIPVGGVRGTAADLPCCVGGARADCGEADMSDKPAWLQSGPNNEGVYPALTDACTSTTPGTSPNTNGCTLARFEIDRLESLRAIDDMVGDLYATLEARNQENQTIFWFTSDNGFPMGQHRRGGTKAGPYEHDTRVPLIVRGGGFREGQTRTLPVLNIDAAMTFAEAIGGSFAGGDGRSLLPLLRGYTPSAWRKAISVTHWWSDSVDPRTRPLNSYDMPDYRAIRTFDAHTYPNRLYVEYLATGAAPYAGTQNEPPWTQPTAVECEHYNLGTDPFQVAADTSDCSALDAEQTALSSQLATLSTTTGAAHRTAEEQ